MQLVGPLVRLWTSLFDIFELEQHIITTFNIMYNFLNIFDMLDHRHTLKHAKRFTVIERFRVGHSSSK